MNQWLTRSSMSLRYKEQHETTRNINQTHNPKVEGSNPSPATKTLLPNQQFPIDPSRRTSIGNKIYGADAALHVHFDFDLRPPIGVAFPVIALFAKAPYIDGAEAALRFGPDADIAGQPDGGFTHAAANVNFVVVLGLAVQIHL